MLANFFVPILQDGWRFIAIFAGVTFLARALVQGRVYRVRCFYTGDQATRAGISAWSIFEEI